MKPIHLLLPAILFLSACTAPKNEPMSSITEKNILSTINAIQSKGQNADTTLLARGIRNAAGFWKKTDGTPAEFQAFCENNFQYTPEAKAKLLATMERNLEIIYGNYNRINLNLKVPIQEVGGEITSMDESFGAIDPYAHFSDDMFHSKIAFSVLLNFPFYTLKEKNKLGANWSRQEWAYARLGDLFAARVPAEVSQLVSTELSTSDNYISAYNIKMGKLRNENDQQLFADSMSLIAHWGLRDELKADYADKQNGLEKQRIIYQVMKHIVQQTIPMEIINSETYTWKPISNKIYKKGAEAKATPEPDTRYARLFATYEAMKATDQYCPNYPTAIARAFDRDMEVSSQNMEKIFTELVSSPEVGLVAKLIRARLGRDLEPFDIWYDGFKSRSHIPEEQLTAQTKVKYPTCEAFEKDMPNILIKMGMKADRAAEISSKITVDNSRGSGHAWGAQMRTDKAHLRTRLAAGGMDYKGYNIATHEFGHNVEQTMTLNDVDHYLLNGVPSTAFTETLAFVFQKRDLELLGIQNSDPNKASLQTLDIFWGCYEIMGVSLVEIRTWRWLYNHPEATVEDLKATVLKSAKDVWNEFYAPYLGEKDSPILAVYSHMIEYPLYLSNYPYGHIVEYQMEAFFAGKNVGNEMQRMYPAGRLTPDHWMEHAVGSPVSTKPMLMAVRKAISAF
jgi:hypothetical protein